MLKRVLVLAVVSSVLLVGLPANAHVQTRSDPDDFSSLLDVEKASFWHRNAHFFFEVKMYDKWSKSYIRKYRRLLKINLDTYGGSSADYAIVFKRRVMGGGELPDKVHARLYDYAAEDYIRPISSQRTSRRKILFSFKKSRIEIRDGGCDCVRWQVVSIRRGSECSADGTCKDLAPDAGHAGWGYRHNF